MISGFQSYVEYVFLKRHFNDYDFIWSDHVNYTRLKESSFDKRKDKGYFKKLEKNFPNRSERIEYLVSVFLFNNDIWIGDIFDDDASLFHTERIRRVSGLESLFHSDAEKIEFYFIDKKIDLRTALLTTGTNSPTLIQDARTVGVSFETLTVLNHFTSFTDLWFPLHPLLKVRRLQLHKYKHLLHLADRKYDKLQSTYQHLAHISA